MADPGLAYRFFIAKNQLERRLGRDVTFAELGELVAKSQGRDEPYAVSVARRWLRAEQEPSTRELWIALARALGVDVGWLAFGAASAAPAPEGYIEPAAPVKRQRVAKDAPGIPMPSSEQLAGRAKKKGA